ncbi:MAG TPA: monooxygenase, partial [Reyranella sp.]|nr:monooxygenase [Reyranella sp.]
MTDWLQRFEQALSGSDRSLAALFQGDSHWRDVLALTWRIHTVSGRDAVVQSLGALANRPRRLEI